MISRTLHRGAGLFNRLRLVLQRQIQFRGELLLLLALSRQRSRLCRQITDAVLQRAKRTALAGQLHIQLIARLGYLPGRNARALHGVARTRQRLLNLRALVA